MDYKNKYLKYKYKYFSLFGGSTELYKPQAPQAPPAQPINAHKLAHTLPSTPTEATIPQTPKTIWDTVLEIYNNLINNTNNEYDIKLKLNDAIYYNSDDDTEIVGSDDFTCIINSATNINFYNAICVNSRNSNLFIKKDSTFVQITGIYIINNIDTNITELHYLQDGNYIFYTNITDLIITRMAQQTTDVLAALKDAQPLAHQLPPTSIVAPKIQQPPIPQTCNTFLEIINNLKYKIIISYTINIKLDIPINYINSSDENILLIVNELNCTITYEDVKFDSQYNINYIIINVKPEKFFYFQQNSFITSTLYINNNIDNITTNLFYVNKGKYVQYTKIKELIIVTSEISPCYSLSLNSTKYNIDNNNFIECIQNYIKKECKVKDNILGEGGFGANCIYLNRQLGIKYNMDPNTNSEIINEINILIKIKNEIIIDKSNSVADNILSIYSYYYDSTNIEKYNFFLYNYYSNYYDLTHYCTNNLCILYDNEKIYIIKTLLNVIKNIHDINIKYRDIKLENIIYNRETKNMILIDFGLATDKDTSNDIAGTEEYIDHYRYELNKEYTNEILILNDYWAIGILIWKLYNDIKGNPFDIKKDDKKNHYTFQGIRNISTYYNLINDIIINDITNEIITNEIITKILEMKKKKYEISTILQTINQINTISKIINDIPDITNLLSNTNFSYVGNFSFWNFFAKEERKK